MSLILVLRNDAKELSELSNYTCEVLVGDGTPERSTTLFRARVEGHQRSLGWIALTQMLLDQAKTAEAASAQRERSGAAHD